MIHPSVRFALPLLLASIRFVPLAAPAVAADADACRFPEAAAFADVERDACSAIALLKDPPCAECPDLAKLQAYTLSMKKRGREACIRGLKDFACTVSPWKDLTVRERYAKIRELSEEVRTPFPKEVLACIAARESLYLDPVSITCSDLSGETTQTGLGHIRRATFEDIFGVDWRAPSEVAALVRKAAWLAPYNCGEPPPKPRDIFAGAYQRDPLVQLNAMARVLRNTAYLKPGASDEDLRANLRTAVRNYNGSATREAYADAVVACVSCLQNGGDVLRCLEKASTEKYGKTGKICP